MAPVQVKVLPISEKHFEYAAKVEQRLGCCGFRVENDTRSEKIGYKIREAQKQKIPYMLIVGDNETEQGTVSVRSRKEGEVGALNIEAFIKKIEQEVLHKDL